MSNYSAYFALEKQIQNKGVDPDRAELMHEFTKGKKTSLRALTEREYREFLQWLEERFEFTSTSLSVKKWKNSPENKMRQKLWTLFVQKMQYSQKHYEDWVIKYGLFHKPIKEHNLKELVALVSQAEKVYKSFINGVNATPVIPSAAEGSKTRM